MLAPHAQPRAAAHKQPVNTTCCTIPSNQTAAPLHPCLPRQGAIYVTSNGAMNWTAAVQETVDATLNRVISSGIRCARAAGLLLPCGFLSFLPSIPKPGGTKLACRLHTLAAVAPWAAALLMSARCAPH